MDYQNFIQITNQTLNEDFSQKPYLLLDCSQLKKMQRTAMLGYGGIPLWRNVLKMEDETVSPVLLELDKRDFACQIKQICEKCRIYRYTASFFLLWRQKNLLSIWDNILCVKLKTVSL